MKTLMLSTALVTASAVGAMAQDTTGTMSAEGSGSNVPAFLSSEFTGMSLYTVESEDARALRDGGADMSAAERDRLRWTSSETFTAQRDSWNDIGAINDIVMTQDGEIRGVLVDIGGFLGLGARTVMVDLNDIYFVSEEVPEAGNMAADDQVADGQPVEGDPVDGQAADTQMVDEGAQDLSDFSVVVSMSEEELEALPEWDEEQMSAGFEQRDYGTGGTSATGMEDDSATMETDPAASETDTAETDDASTTTTTGETTTTTGAGDMDVFSEDYQMLAAEDRTAEALIGAAVYDANGENIGNVDDVVLGGGDAVDGVIVDVGGFLGIGTHTVNLPIEDAQIGWRADDDDVRVQVSMTGDELEAMPEYDG